MAAASRGVARMTRRVQKYWQKGRGEAVGSFSNGTEGVGFEELWCERCIHYAEPDAKKQCAVWMLHLCFNSEQHESGMTKPHSGTSMHGPTLKSMLSALIQEKRGGGQECLMFTPRADARVTGGDVYCSAFRHMQPIEDRNSGAPCIVCLAEKGVLHHVEA